MNNPLVTITIPTRNSEKTLKRCLEAIVKQGYKNLEINIVDGNSTDNGMEIAKKLGVKKIIKYGGQLLGARYEGVKNANGRYTLILDSDQILEPGSLVNAVKLAEEKSIDMLVFKEDVYKANTFIEKLFKLDRKLIETVNDLSPFTGVIMPRFFRTTILKKAYQNIPKSVYTNTGGPDHAIVYYEAYNLSKKIDALPYAVKHIEPTSLLILWSKFFRWGYTAIDAHSHKKYTNLMKQKERFRTGLFSKGIYLESLASITLVVLKGLAFKGGFYKAKLDRKFSK